MVEVHVEKLAHARDARDPLPDQGLELRGRPADGEGGERPDAGHRPPGQGGMERIGNDVEIGQFRHGRRLYPRSRGARLARPMGTDS